MYKEAPPPLKKTVLAFLKTATVLITGTVPVALSFKTLKYLNILRFFTSKIKYFPQNFTCDLCLTQRNTM